MNKLAIHTHVIFRPRSAMFLGSSLNQDGGQRIPVKLPIIAH